MSERRRFWPMAVVIGVVALLAALLIPSGLGSGGAVGPGSTATEPGSAATQTDPGQTLVATVESSGGSGSSARSSSSPRSSVVATQPGSTGASPTPTPPPTPPTPTPPATPTGTAGPTPTPGLPCDATYAEAPSTTADQSASIQTFLTANAGKRICFAAGAVYRTDTTIRLYTAGEPPSSDS
jgi:hypothetical protein